MRTAAIAPSSPRLPLPLMTRFLSPEPQERIAARVSPVCSWLDCASQADATLSTRSALRDAIEWLSQCDVKYVMYHPRERRDRGSQQARCPEMGGGVAQGSMRG